MCVPNDHHVIDICGIKIFLNLNVLHISKKKKKKKKEMPALTDRWCFADILLKTKQQKGKREITTQPNTQHTYFLIKIFFVYIHIRIVYSVSL